ncbi:hypothetical protein UFOVP965_35 [uncultured Caudovirales phage]|uniref:Gp5/Type VI secretion system Vgr protein OB-fold domain-containing protein n=1 Tax=uncultured Caudovirales phage TaxID=2100421 RepID=A0A6J5Q663_9CAUD|nr:hypothetical protein UFOVP965_35 [uncultured Caudovirales phage]CAB4179749.1 hypothetical protein UFOVP1035_31 [uncultured Caudovirales phage]CAB4188865.1 hypothetical protein UFOVP1181_137 [uncultured Caudovirales phage]
MTADKRYYGIYSGYVELNDDPDDLGRVTVIVPQVTGPGFSTGWARPCNPVTNTANHLDHLPHLASEVAALLTTHSDHSVSVSGTTGAASAGTAHTHAFSATQTLTHAAHAGTAGELTHPHVDITDPLDKDGSEIGLDAAEHTYHRVVPEVGQHVWVMYEGGDPNFPVWIGTAL